MGHAFYVIRRLIRSEPEIQLPTPCRRRSWPGPALFETGGPLACSEAATCSGQLQSLSLAMLRHKPENPCQDAIGIAFWRLSPYGKPFRCSGRQSSFFRTITCSISGARTSCLNAVAPRTARSGLWGFARHPIHNGLPPLPPVLDVPLPTGHPWACAFTARQQHESLCAASYPPVGSA